MSKPVILTKCTCHIDSARCVECKTQWHRAFRVENCYTPFLGCTPTLAFIPPHDRDADPAFRRDREWRPLVALNSIARLGEAARYWVGEL